MCCSSYCLPFSLSPSVWVCVSILENCFSKICQQMRRAGPPHTQKTFSFAFALQRPHWSSSSVAPRSVGRLLGGLVGCRSQLCLAVFVQCPVCSVSPPGVGIWRLVAAIECVKIIVNFSDTHHTSMGRLSATPCQGQRHGQHQGGRRGRGGGHTTKLGPAIGVEIN